MPLLLNITHLDRAQVQSALHEMNVTGLQLIEHYPCVTAILLDHYRELMQTHEAYSTSYYFLVDIVASYCNQHQETIFINIENQENIKRMIKMMGQQSLLNFKEELLVLLSIDEAALPFLTSYEVVISFFNQLISNSQQELEITDKFEATRILYRRLIFQREGAPQEKLNDLFTTLKNLLEHKSHQHLEKLMLILTSANNNPEIQYRIRRLQDYFNDIEFQGVFTEENKAALSTALLSSLTQNTAGMTLTAILGPLFSGYEQLITLRAECKKTIETFYHSFYMMGEIAADIITLSGTSWSSGILAPVRPVPLQERYNSAQEARSITLHSFVTGLFSVPVNTIYVSLTEGTAILSQASFAQIMSASMLRASGFSLCLTAWNQTTRLMYALDTLNEQDPYKTLTDKYRHSWMVLGQNLLNSIPEEQSKRKQHNSCELQRLSKSFLPYFDGPADYKSEDPNDILEELIEKKVFLIRSNSWSTPILSFRQAGSERGKIRDFYQKYLQAQSVYENLSKVISKEEMWTEVGENTLKYYTVGKYRPIRLPTKP